MDKHPDCSNPNWAQKFARKKPQKMWPMRRKIWSFNVNCWFAYIKWNLWSHKKCIASFVIKSSWNSKWFIHTGKKSYACCFCNENFRLQFKKTLKKSRWSKDFCLWQKIVEHSKTKWNHTELLNNVQFAKRSLVDVVLHILENIIAKFISRRSLKLNPSRENWYQKCTLF